jgi:hypothetical protein
VACLLPISLLSILVERASKRITKKTNDLVLAAAKAPRYGLYVGVGDARRRAPLLVPRRVPAHHHRWVAAPSPVGFASSESVSSDFLVQTEMRTWFGLSMLGKTGWWDYAFFHFL